MNITTAGIVLAASILAGIYFVCWLVDTIIDAVRRHRGEKGVVLTGDEADRLIGGIDQIVNLLSDRFTLAEGDSKTLAEIRDAVDKIEDRTPAD